MPTPREDRIARNEVAFRSFNEQLTASRGIDDREPDEVLGFVCECGDLDCEAFVQAPVSVYRRVRSDDCDFLIVPGHEILGVEDVVEQTAHHAIVHKHAGVEDIVDRHPPAST